MAIDFTKNYDIVKIIDIPENEISEKLKEVIKNEIRYQDTDEGAHLYNASQILELSNIAQEVRKELDTIDELVGINNAIYFRITRD